MKKLGLLGLVLMFVALIMVPANADGVAVGDGKPLTLKLDVDAPWAFRSRDVNVFHNACGLALNKTQQSDFVMAPLVSLTTEWALKDKVTAIVQLENVRLQTTAAGGTVDNAEFGSGLNIAPIFRQAYLKVEDFVADKLAMSYGVQPLKLTLRKGEGAFFMDVSYSLSPSLMMPLDMQIANRAATVRGYGEFSGFNFKYGNAAADNYEVGFFFGNTGEFPVVTRPVPAVTDGLRNEDRLLGFTLTYKLAGEDNAVKAIVAQSSNSFTEMNIMTIGVGADYFGAMPNKVLEIYGEAYMQSGTASNNGVKADGVTPCDVDQAAMAYRIGAQYNLAHDLKPTFGLSYWFVDGGDDSVRYKAGSTKYTENNHFVSYENSQSTLILEDNVYGLNLNSNYTAIKVEAGITTNFNFDRQGEPEPLHVKLLLGSFTLNKVPYMAIADPVTGKSKTNSALGTEIDVVATLEATKNLSLSLGLGMLSGGDFFGSVRFTDAAGKATKFDSMNMVVLDRKSVV